MQGFSLLVKLIVKFFVFIFKKLGLNVVLLILLVIEVIGMGIYYSNNCRNYVYENDSQLEAITEFIPIDASDLPDIYKDGISDSSSNYLLTLQIGNYYLNETRYPNLYMRNQDKQTIFAKRLGYYDDLKDYDEFYPNSIIPPGTVVQAPYLVSVTGSTLDTTTEVIIYHSYLETDAISDKQLEKKKHILRTALPTIK